MYKKSEFEMERAKIIKITRTLVRLKHSLAADMEVNEILPDKLAEFDRALQSGTLLSEDYKTAFGELGLDDGSNS